MIYVIVLIAGIFNGLVYNTAMHSVILAHEYGIPVTTMVLAGNDVSTAVSRLSLRELGNVKVKT